MHGGAMNYLCLIPFLLWACLPLVSLGQSASFELLARNDEYGSVNTLAELPDGNICVGSTRGLSVYAPTDSGLTILFAQSGDTAVRDVAVRADGAVFAACGAEGLHAYQWDGKTLGFPVRAPFVQSAQSVAVGNDGILICAGWKSGYFAIEWDGNALIAIDSFPVNTWAESFALAANGDVIVCGRSRQDDSIRAVRLQNRQFVQIAAMEIGPVNKAIYPTINGEAFYLLTDDVSVVHYDSSGFEPGQRILSDYISSIAGTDSIVYVGDGQTLLVYRLQGNSYILVTSVETNNVGAVDILPASNGLIHTAECTDGQGVYALQNDRLVETGRVNDGGFASDVVQGPDGVIWVANAGNGVRAYRRVDSMLISVAHIDGGGYAFDIAVAEDGTVFVANGWDGLRAYSMHDGQLRHVGHFPDSGWCVLVEVGPDGTIYSFNTRSGLSALHYDGNEIERLAVFPPSAWAEDLAVAADGNVFLGNGNMGLEAYAFSGDSLIRRARIDHGSVFGVTVSPDNTVFSALVHLGLRVYQYDGTRFTSLVHDEDLKGSEVRRDENGIVFVSGLSSDHIKAYQFDGNSFTLLATYPLSTWCMNLGDSGSVFASTNFGQVVMLRYHSAVTGIPVPDRADDAQLQNFPNPFRPATTIQFHLQRPTRVTLSVFDSYGRKVQDLIEDERREVGHHTAVFYGRGLPPGVYIYILNGEGQIQLGNMLLLR